ncbi:MAG: hypothetical protein IJ048_04725 [Clostridia bacterium]|nr:hypothetical protein [Clostridia bacterium]
MNSKERLAAYIAGRDVDRRPNLTIVGSAVARYADGGAGMDVETYCKDYRKMAEAAAVAAREMGLDFIQIASDLLREAEGYGTTVSYFSDKLPTAAKYAIDDIEDVPTLHTLKAAEIPRLYDLVKAAEIALADPDVDPMVLAVGPMTVAGNIRGVEDLLVDMFDEPELVAQLLETVTGTTLDFIDCLAKAGVKYAYVADPVASLVSPGMYEELVLPVHKKIYAKMADVGITGRLHMCGNTTAILPHSSQCGAAIIDIDHMVDFDQALQAAQGRCILNGNIDPVADVYTCDAAHTKAAILACAEKIGKRRAMFMPGCELPTDTPTENIRAIAEALKEIGA